MAHRVVLFVIALAFFATTVSSRPEPSRCVFVEDTQGTGTGIILHKNQVVTDNHEVSGETKVNGKVAKVEKLIEDIDIAFLQVETLDIPPIRWGDARVGDSVYYVGNPAEHHCLLIRGVVVEVGAQYIWVDMKVLPGSSGSGIYNDKDQLVGIVQQLEEYGPVDGLGKALRSSVIRANLP